jgi:hypothetical protein
MEMRSAAAGPDWYDEQSLSKLRKARGKPEHAPRSVDLTMTTNVKPQAMSQSSVLTKVVALSRMGRLVHLQGSIVKKIS